MSKSFHRRVWLLGLLSILVALTFGLFISCGQQTPTPVEPQESQQEVVLSKTDPAVQAVMAVQERNAIGLLARKGVVGVATGQTAKGVPALLILTVDDRTALSMPSRVEGVPVRTMVTGVLKAIKGGPPGGGGFDPTQKHRPAPNGVSIGHPDITAGTLGCLVEGGSKTYILSNNHVMANENQANINDPIYQPGPFDGGDASCTIATLSDFKDIVFSTSAENVIDAAIAEVNSADVTGATDASSYGLPRTATVAASVGVRVMKYGRTTEETKARIDGINATVNIGYDSGTAQFVNQIIISPGSFSAGGDSGSLIVVQKGSDKRKPVGLLFAGSQFVTIANPIDAVLNEFGVSVVGD